ncbi:hypothetical protein [Chitinophaga eiseniae]|uniref:hypothetical protein n=1 Tax=Chitinophaga eiseniae TaxID=634771 RepID=UPI001177FE6B|nr:hypothetical protein [Chitinophaga eiseniae]
MRFFHACPHHRPTQRFPATSLANRYHYALTGPRHQPRQSLPLRPDRPPPPASPIVTTTP